MTDVTIKRALFSVSDKSGLAELGKALAARGVRTVVVERWPEVYPQPRAVHLDDEVYRVLVRLGLEDDLARLTRPCAGLRLVDADLRVLASFDRSGASPVTGYPRANMFDQPVLDAVLRERLRSTPEVTLLTGREVVGVEQESADHVVVLHRPLDDDGPQERLEASFLLGCDGANSVVRRELGGRMVDLGFEQRFAIFLGDLVVVGVDLAEGEEAVAVATEIHEGRLQRRFDPCNLG